MSGIMPLINVPDAVQYGRLWKAMEKKEVAL